MLSRCSEQHCYNGRGSSVRPKTKRTLPACCTRHTASARKFGDVLSSCYELSLSSVEAKELSSVAVSQKCSHRSIAEQLSPS